MEAEEVEVKKRSGRLRLFYGCYVVPFFFGLPTIVLSLWLLEKDDHDFQRERNFIGTINLLVLDSKRLQKGDEVGNRWRNSHSDREFSFHGQVFKSILEANALSGRPEGGTLYITSNGICILSREGRAPIIVRDANGLITVPDQFKD